MSSKRPPAPTRHTSTAIERLQRVGSAVGIRNVAARVPGDGVVDVFRYPALSALTFEGVAERMYVSPPTTHTEI